MSKQELLYMTIKNSKDVIEFIKHNDNHYWVYYNGQQTDTMFPRSLSFNKNDKPYEIFKELWFGKSLYNKEKITNFFKDLEPEEFL